MKLFKFTFAVLFMLCVAVSCSSDDDKVDGGDESNNDENGIEAVVSIKNELIGFWEFNSGIKSIQFEENYLYKIVKSDGSTIHGLYSITAPNMTKSTGGSNAIALIKLEGFTSVQLISIKDNVLEMDVSGASLSAQRKNQAYSLGFIEAIWDNGTQTYNVSLVDSDGQQITFIKSFSEYIEILAYNEFADELYYSWSPSGYTASVYRLNLTSKTENLIANVASEDVKITADGRIIYYKKDMAGDDKDYNMDVLMRKDLVTGTESMITEEQKGLDIDDWSISGDGSIVVFKADFTPAGAEDDDSDLQQLYIVTNNGKKQVKIADESDKFKIDYGQLSPNQTAILTGDDDLVCSCDLKGENKKTIKNVVELEGVKWSADGKFVYYGSYQNGSTSFFKIDMNSNATSPLSVNIENAISIKMYNN